VVRYYTDRSGYVTAMDVLGTDGMTRMVRFSPGMGQRLYTTYPVGSQASVYTTASGTADMMRMDVVGMGDAMPSAMAQPFMATDIQVLEAPAFITLGAKLSTVNGNLRRVITNETGDVLALVLDNASKDGTAMSEGSEALVRVPREFRAVGTMVNTADMAAPLFPGSKVTVVGYEEAPRYGAVSRYGSRVIANTITLNNRSVGMGGIARIASSKRNDTILGLNILGGVNTSKEEMMASGMGYSTYPPATASMSGDMGTTTTTDAPMTGDTTGTGTVGGSTGDTTGTGGTGGAGGTMSGGSAPMTGGGTTQ